MATIILRQSNVVISDGGIIKGAPLTNSEVDNNFANVNVAVVHVSNTLTNVNVTLTASISTVNVSLTAEISNVNANLTASIASTEASIIPFAIALG